VTARQKIGVALARLGERDGLARIAAFVAVFAALASLFDIVATAAFGTEAGILGQAGPGRIAAYFLCLALVFLFLRTGPRPSEIGLRGSAGWRGVVARGWLFGIGGYLAYALLLRTGGAVEFRAPKSLVAFAGAVPLCAVAGLGIATAEEIIFRGFLLRTAAGALPRWPAIVVTGILFGFFHDLANPGDLLAEPADRMLFGGVFCLHLLLCASAIRTRSLHLGIGIHSGLVFGEALFRRLRLFDVADDESWFLGLDGDPRRGFIAWGLFIASALLIPWLMGKRAMGAVTGRAAIQFAPAAPGWLVRLVDRVASIGRRREFACWVAIAALAVAVRLWVLGAIPFALAHDGSASIFDAASALPKSAPRGGWLITGIVGFLAQGQSALCPLVWLQHGAVLLGLCSLFVALRRMLGPWAFLPLAACALGCSLHGMPVYVAHHVLPGAFQFALNALAISSWAMRLAGGGPALAFASALFASAQGFNAFLAWPLVAAIVLRELFVRGGPVTRSLGTALAVAGAALPIIVAAFLAPASPRSYLNPTPQAPSILASVAHLDPALTRAPPKVRDALAPLLKETPGMSRDKRRSHFGGAVSRALIELEPDPSRRDALCLELALGIAAEKPLAVARTWSRQTCMLLCRGSDNISYPGESDLRRTARYTRRAEDGPAMEIHQMATELLPKFEGRQPGHAPEVLVWFLLILPPILATTLLLAAALCIGPSNSRWLAAGCLAIWLPALFRFSVMDDISGRVIVGLLPIAMLTLSATATLGCRAAVDALRGPRQ